MNPRQLQTHPIFGTHPEKWRPLALVAAALLALLLPPRAAEPAPLGHVRLRRRLLHAAGWRVASLGVHEWDAEHLGADPKQRAAGRQLLLQERLAELAAD